MTIAASRQQHAQESARETDTWQNSMRRAIRDAGELCRRLRLPDDVRTEALASVGDFPVFAPLEYVARMRVGDENDPLLRQVLPLAAELEDVDGFSHDPLQESHAMLSPGLLQKYQGRALLVATGACAIHCRYCFRRHFPYSDNSFTPERWKETIEQISADESIEEVLLSGGDPLTIADTKLEFLIESIAAIEHVKRLRIHTRLPIVLPNRVTNELVQILRETSLAVLVVVHANHPHELGETKDDPVCQALSTLVDNGIPVLNQAVLLRGINDDVDVLYELHRRLINQRVLPYYLHQLDPVAGTAHFEIPVSQGKQLVEQLRGRLPGYAVPRYVQELPGQANKTPLL